MLVELTDKEMARAAEKALEVHERKRAAGIRLTVHHADNVDVMTTAFAAETAFHQLFPFAVQSEMPRLPDGTIDPHAGDGGFDFEFPRTRLTVDVKSRRGNDDVLIIPGKQWPPCADIYVLAVQQGDPRMFMFTGWAWGEDVENNARQTTGNDAGPYWYIERRELHPMSLLFNEVM